MEDHGARKVNESGRRVGVGVTCVDHDRQARRSSHLELAVEERPLCVAGSEIVEVVEPDFADRDGTRVLEQLDELPDPCSFPSSRLVRIDPKGRRDSLLRLGDRERRPTGHDPGADCDNPRDADGAGPLDEKGGGLLAPVEMGVGVDHAGSGSSRGKSGAAASIPSVSPVRP